MKRDRLNYLTNFESKFDKYLYATYLHIFQEKILPINCFHITIIEDFMNCLNTQTMDKSHIFQ